MTKDEARRIAEHIAGKLFTNGVGERAQRLVLTIDGPPTRDIGGWAWLSVVDVIAAELEATP